MKTPQECAVYMRERYSKDAEIHCTYAIMGNDGCAQRYWRDVYAALLEYPQ